MTETDKRSFALGYLACLRMIRTLHSERKMPWEKAVAEAGKKLYLFVEGGEDVEAEDHKRTTQGATADTKTTCAKKKEAT